jgi:uncharacterized repeat protein (TIGR01451 family)
MIKYALLAIAASTAFSSLALADTLSANQSVERMIVSEAADGTVKVDFAPAVTVVPGETLVYWLNYANESDQSAANVVLTVPVPDEVTYVESTAAADQANVDFSADGGKTFAPRGDLAISANGQSREALAAEITHVRWTFKSVIPANSEGRLGFQAVLD